MKKNINKTFLLLGTIGALTLTGCATATCAHAKTQCNATHTMVYRDPIDRLLDIPRYVFGVAANATYTATNGTMNVVGAGIKGIEDAGFGGRYFGHGNYNTYKTPCIIRIRPESNLHKHNQNCR